MDEQPKLNDMTPGSWMFLYIASAVMDIIQYFIEIVLIWLFGIGAGINEVVDPIVGIAIAWYLNHKKVYILQHPKYLITLVGTEAMAALSLGWCQFWVLAVWLIHKDVKVEEAEFNEQLAKTRVVRSGRPESFYKNGRGRVRA